MRQTKLATGQLLGALKIVWFMDWFIHSFYFVQAAIKHANSNNNRTGQQGTKVHLQLPSNYTDILATIEPKVTKNFYTFNSSFKNSEWVKIDCVWQGSPNVNYMIGKNIITNTWCSAVTKNVILMSTWEDWDEKKKFLLTPTGSAAGWMCAKSWHLIVCRTAGGNFRH